MTASSWWKNLVKGGIADTICATHFNAAGWNVAETGIEHIVPSFAQRDRKSDENNEHRIQEHIGLLPDLLVHRPNRSHFLVEVKFRNNIATADDLEKFIGDLLWQYRHLLFRNYDPHLFPTILPLEWYEHINEDDRRLPDLSARFKAELERNRQRIAPHFIKLPLLFYIVSPTVNEGPRVHLACPRFDDTGFSYVSFSLHDGSLDGHNTEDIEAMVREMRAAWQDEIKPALDCMFPYKAIARVDEPAKPTWDYGDDLVIPVVNVAVLDDSPLTDETPTGDEPFVAALRICVERIAKRENRRGAYVQEVLGEEDFWQTLEPIGIARCGSIQEALDLLRANGIGMTRYSTNTERKRDYINLPI